MRLTLPRYPRWLQIAFLSAFLAFGLAARDFPLWHAPLIWASALATQWLCLRLSGARAAAASAGVQSPPSEPEAWRLGASFWLSPVITCFGLTLLLRTDEPWVPVVAAVIAISSKFILRVRDRHLFNPANIGVCAAMLLTSHAWSSPAQWGEGATTLLWFGALGLAVAHRAFRSDTSLAFLAAWTLLRLGRVLFLGQRLAVLEHQLASAGLLLFAFFMISDPKTTPQTRSGRILYSALVACVAFALTHVVWARSPLLWALFVCSPLVPLFDLTRARVVHPRSRPAGALETPCRSSSTPSLHAA